MFASLNLILKVLCLSKVLCHSTNHCGNIDIHLWIFVLRLTTLFFMAVSIKSALMYYDFIIINNLIVISFFFFSRSNPDRDCPIFNHGVFPSHWAEMSQSINVEVLKALQQSALTIQSTSWLQVRFRLLFPLLSISKTFKGTRCLGSGELNTGESMKSIWNRLRIFFLSTIYRSTHVCLEIAWFSFYFNHTVSHFVKSKIHKLIYSCIACCWTKFLYVQFPRMKTKNATKTCSWVIDKIK